MNINRQPVPTHILTLIFALFFSIPLTAQSQRIEYFVYKTTPQAELQIFVHYPPNWSAKDMRPTIVFFFGSGWNNGSMYQFLTQAEYFASRGMVTARADYRVNSRHGTKPEQCVEDGKSAVRWMRKNAHLLGIDPNRIVAAGGSAGGHVAACTYLTEGLNADDEDASISSKPNALLLFNPVLSLMEFDLTERAESEESAKNISPLLNIHSSTPPTMLFYGTQDQFIAQGQEFVRKTKELGASTDIFIAQNAPHGFFNDAPWLQHTMISADRFLIKIGFLTGEPTIQVEPEPSPAILMTPTPKPGDNPDSGKQRIIFQEHHPLTKDKEMTRRTGIRMGAGPKAGYFYDIQDESFELYVPPDYDGSEPYGLIVWISAGQSGSIPDMYIPLMDKHKFIWIGANNSGNKEAVYERRIPLALDAAYNIQKHYKIDPNRTYVSGVSGGGRVSSGAAFLYSDVFAGGIFVIGANHWESQRLPGKNLVFSAGFPEPPSGMIRNARLHGRYVLLTGENDINREQMEVIYNNGFSKHVTFLLYIEVPDMGHRIPDPDWFEKALQYVDNPMPFRDLNTDSIRDSRNLR